MGSDLNHPWVREQYLNEQLRKLEAENAELRAKVAKVALVREQFERVAAVRRHISRMREISTDTLRRRDRELLALADEVEAMLAVLTGEAP